jgi:hypothetical protein
MQANFMPLARGVPPDCAAALYRRPKRRRSSLRWMSKAGISAARTLTAPGASAAGPSARVRMTARRMPILANARAAVSG